MNSSFVFCFFELQHGTAKLSAELSFGDLAVSLTVTLQCFFRVATALLAFEGQCQCGTAKAPVALLSSVYSF